MVALSLISVPVAWAFVVLSPLRKSSLNRQSLWPRVAECRQWSPRTGSWVPPVSHIASAHPGCGSCLLSEFRALWETSSESYMFLFHMLYEQTGGWRRKELFEAHRSVSDRALAPSKAVNSSIFLSTGCGVKTFSLKHQELAPASFTV